MGEMFVDEVTGTMKFVSDRVTLMKVDAVKTQHGSGVDVAISQGMLDDPVLLPAVLKDVRNTLDGIEAMYLGKGGAA